MVHQSLVTRPAAPPKALAQHELEALKSVRMNSRDRALIAVLSMCGLRVSEACSLTVDNIHWSTDTPSLRFADKRGKERVVPMNPEVQDVLREWLESRRFSDSRVRLLQSPQRAASQPQDRVGGPEDLRAARGDPPRPSAHAQAYLRH